MVTKLPKHSAGPYIRRRDETGEASDVIASSPAPRDVAKIKVVCHPEVGERHESVLIDRIPEPELGRDAAVEPLQHRKPVTSFGSSRKPQQLRGSNMLQQALVRRGGRMMKFVD